MNLLVGDLMLLLLDRGVGDDKHVLHSCSSGRTTGNASGDILTGMRPPVSRRE
jgi:hypothetical protein